ncbi:unnamed protein product [Ambrosiozyma monospora]|uniref:Unnamed protein product n=1 Tax=Ambrosiozyma monospora TaxID=43982 RepID=A0ACB5U5Z8_AMBMO|nr:unnamed protein product [Ambrosiozyma monospora]
MGDQQQNAQQHPQKLVARSNSLTSEAEAQLYITIENLRVDEIWLVSSTFKLKIKNGLVDALYAKDALLAKKLSISENISTLVA